MSELTPSKATPLAGVPFFVCRIPAVAAGDPPHVADFLKRLAWVPRFGFTLFPCAHERPCPPATGQDWSAVAALSPDAELLVQQIQASP